ncbi:MAG: peptidoglycan-binding domain-containing protein [Myxococcaceae bacterium]|nr:peptidoglycan-binding domain-containing protein [Myxococcaceae bacterium]
MINGLGSPAVTPSSTATSVAPPPPPPPPAPAAPPVGFSGESSFEGAPVPATPTTPAARGTDIRDLQTRLQESGFDPGPIDGRFGPRTEGAITRLRGAEHLTPVASSQAVGAAAPPPPNGTARLDQVREGRGLTTGRLTVNGNTYEFTSGNSKRFSVPQGEFNVTKHLDSRGGRSFVRDGVGYSFTMEDPNRPGSDRFYDARAGRDRQYLRIHPDGGPRGTAGCIGIVGDGATQRRFRDDLNAELARNNGVFRLHVQ